MRNSKTTNLAQQHIVAGLFFWQTIR